MITRVNSTNINSTFFKQYSSVSFAGDKKFPTLDKSYTTEKSKNNTITIWGSSSTVDGISKHIKIAHKLSKALVADDYNILHGCGDSGIMGATYKGANEGRSFYKNSTGGENLAILKIPLWGDEDTENCKVIGTAEGEAERAKKFMSCSNTFVIFPGSAATIQEVSNLIQGNLYAKKPEDRKKVILVGKDYYKGLMQQYKNIEKIGLLKGNKSEDLFVIAENFGDIAKHIPELKK